MKEPLSVEENVLKKRCHQTERIVFKRTVSWLLMLVDSNQTFSIDIAFAEGATLTE